MDQPAEPTTNVVEETLRSPATIDTPGSASKPNVMGQTANLIGRQAVLVLMALAANIIAARTLAPDGRGALAFALQAAYMVSFGILLGTEKAVAVVMPGEGIEHGVPSIWSTVWRRAVAVFLVGLILGGLLTAYFLMSGNIFGAVIFGMLAFQNWKGAQGQRPTFP